MDTINATPKKQSTLSADVDFDTRLTLATIAIDVALSKHITSPDPGLFVHALPEPEGLPAVVDLSGESPDAETLRHVRGVTVLREAAQLIRERGWAQGKYSREDGALCALGAINEVTRGDVMANAAAKGILMSRIERLHDFRYPTIWTWNDAQDRTWVQVTGLMERS